MTRLALLTIAAVALLALGWRLIKRLASASSDETQPDPMAQPFLDSRNSATYLYNAATGVISSYN